MAQDGTQAPGKGKALFLVHGNLDDPLELIFDGIFNGDDLFFLIMNLGKRPIQGGGLAAAGRPGYQHHAVWFADHPAEPEQLTFCEPQGLQGQPLEIRGDGFLVEDTDDGVLAENARHDRHAKVDRFASHPHFKAAVLGNPPLRNIQLAHDLDTGDDRALESAVERLGSAVQDTVDTIFDDHALKARFDMNVACPLDQGVIEGGIDEANNRAGVGGQFFDGEDFLSLFGLLDQLQLEIFGNLVENPLGTLAPLKDSDDFAFHGHPQNQGHIEQQLEAFTGCNVGGIGNNDDQAIVGLPNRQELVPQRHPRGQGAHQLGFRIKAIQVHVLKLKLGRQSLSQSFAGKKTFLDAGGTEVFTSDLHPLQNQLDLGRGYGTHSNQNLAYPFPFEDHASKPAPA